MMKPQALFLLFVATALQAATPTSNAPFLKPDEAIAKMKVMPGFEVKAFVAEPDIGEAIAFCFDFKGRLWTLENYNYQTRRAHSTDKRNRIQIFEDVDGDGVFDAKRLLRCKSSPPRPTPRTVQHPGARIRRSIVQQ